MLLFLLASLLESLGIGLIGPFISLATAPESIERMSSLSWIYERLGFRSNIQFIIFFGISIICILYIKAVLTFAVQSYVFHFGFEQQVNLRRRLLHAYLTVPYTFHLRQNTAVLIQNIINETSKFANNVLMPALVAFSNIAVTFALVLLLFITDFAATAVILLAMLLAFFVLYQFKSKVARWGKDASEADTEMIRIINHSLGGVKETKVIGCELYFESQLAQQADKYKRATAGFNTIAILPRHLIESLLVTFLVLFTSVSLLSNKAPQELAATLGVFGMASFRLLPSVSNLMNSFNAIKHSTYVIDKLYLDLIELKEIGGYRESKLPQNSGKNSSLEIHTSSVKFNQSIKLEDIVYRYPDTLEPALKNLSLEIIKGQSIGLIGKSGAGKTTLVDVLLGLLEPESGNIKVDDIPVRNNSRTWQNLLAYIPQSIFLIDDTIENNIAFGVPEELIDRQRLQKAIRAAQLTDLIEHLPEGVNTVVGERGVRLSGGQRQRIGIARALYHERQVLVLDEATAALDHETESFVTESIKALGRSKTVIIIAHRLSTIEHCDCIYMLEKGQVVKTGTYQQVVGR
jgi:ABC-type multidrug transport system fused ATPase/permease subunit